MLVAVLLTAPIDTLAIRWMRKLARACFLSTGRGTLDCVCLPLGLHPRLSPRAVRLMRQARVSAW